MEIAWQLLRKGVGKQNNKLYFPITFKIDNEEVSNKRKIAESFYNYFANFGKTTCKNVPMGNPSYINYLDKPIMNSMFMKEIDYLPVMDIVKTLKPKIRIGFDDFSSKFIKETISNRIHLLILSTC